MLIKISVVYAMIHMLILFFMVYQSRYRLRTLITASALVIGSISVVVIWMLFHWGVAAAGQYGMIIGTVPTLLLFFFMAKERHDLRHRLQAVAALVQQEDKAAALEYIGASQAVLDRTGQRRFCKNVVLDAVLSSFFERAQERGIVMESRLTIPDTLPVDATELSTVFANALENAIHACEKVSPEQRRITCTCAASPRLRFEVANPYAGKVRFGPDGLPVSERPGHGIGIHSITAFAEKNHAVCRFVTENGWFKMQMVL